MKQKKNHSLLALLIILTSCASSQLHGVYESGRTSSSSHLKSQDLLWGVLGVVGTMTGVYALGRWCGWWGEASNDTLLESGRNNLAKADKYQGILRLIMRAHEGNTFDIVHQLDEELLYECALAKRAASSIDSYIGNLRSHIADLKSSHRSLSDRMNDLSHDKNWHEVKYVHDRMDNLGRQIKDVVGELELLYAFLHEHKSYFKLFETEDKFAQRYRREIEVLQQYADDEYACRKALRSCILSQYSGAFSLIDFVQKLKRDIPALEHVLERPAYNYATRSGYAHALLQTLCKMREFVVSDKEYVCMLAQYEHAQREKERLRLERERLYAEQRIAAAKEREAYAKQRAAAAKEREARAKEKKNQLKEQEMWQNQQQNYGW